MSVYHDRVPFQALRLLIIVTFFASCMPQTKSTYEHGKLLINFTDSTMHIVEGAFQKRNVDGCFLLYDMEKDTALVFNRQRANQEFLPASTFKIANSLIALERKAVKDINEVIAWDSVERFVPAWNGDQTMRTAFRYSAVWFYQELARRIGREQMDRWVKKLGYGNMAAGPGIDDFWLEGDLRITPAQQVDFLKRLVKEDLPVKEKNVKAVKEIMIGEENERYILRAKTGWADSDRSTGWYVGWLEIEGKNYIFVNNIDIADEEKDLRSRKEIVKEILDAVFQTELKI